MTSLYTSNDVILVYLIIGAEETPEIHIKSASPEPPVVTKQPLKQ